MHSKFWLTRGNVVLISWFLVATMVLAVPFESRAVGSAAGYGGYIYEVWEQSQNPGAPTWEAFDNPSCKGKVVANEYTALSMWHFQRDEWTYQRPGMSRCVDSDELSRLARKDWNDCRNWVRSNTQFHTHRVQYFVVMIVRVYRQNVDVHVFHDEEAAKQEQPDIVRDWQNAACGWSMNMRP